MKTSGIKTTDTVKTLSLFINGSLWDPYFFPSYTPKEMLDMGVFGGTYLNSVREAFPKEWFSGDRVLPPGKSPDPSLNFYGVSSGLTLSEWKRKGWILSDRLGWFQWYCNYYMGRRLGEDEAQIKRWRQFCARHSAQIHKSPEQPRLRQKQALLHWAYNWRDKFTECREKNLDHMISSRDKTIYKKDYVFSLNQQ